MSGRSDGIGAAVQIVEILEVNKDGLYRGMVVVKNHPGHRIISKTDALYLHHLPPFLHLQMGTDIFYDEELEEFVTLRDIRCEQSILGI